MRFSPELLIVDFQSQDAAPLLMRSLKNTGFAVIKNHPISAQLVDEVYREWQQFFASAHKMDYVFAKEKQEGYFPFKSENAKYTPVKDLKEFYHFYPWGRTPEGISRKTLQLRNEMSALAANFLNWIESELPEHLRKPLSMPLAETITDSPKTLFRILNYPPITNEADEGEVRAAAHEDIGMLTLLPAATAKGLQVKDSKGNWHEVPCDYGTIVVNTGDHLSAFTQGYLKATTHQVVNPEGELAKHPRLSMPLFLHARDEVVLPDGRTSGEYTRQRLRELGLI